MKRSFSISVSGSDVLVSKYIHITSIGGDREIE